MTNEGLLISDGFVAVLKHTKIHNLIFAVIWIHKDLESRGWMDIFLLAS